MSSRFPCDAAPSISRAGEALAAYMAGDIAGTDKDQFLCATCQTPPVSSAASVARRLHDQRNVAPVALLTAATTFCDAVSISASVSDRSRGWKTTSIAIDFLPGGSRSPS